MVVPTFPQLSETFIAAKAVGLLDRGWNVQILCGASETTQWDAFGPDHPVQRLHDRVTVAPSPSPTWSGLSAAGRSITGLRHAPRGVVGHYLGRPHTTLGRRVRDLVLDADLLALAPDVVHFEFGSIAPGRMAVGARLGCAVTVSFRGYDLNYVGLDDPNHYKDVWAHADRVHLLGADLWVRAQHRGAPPTLRHDLIPPAIDTADIVQVPARPGRLGLGGDPVRVLSVGRLHWKKGYEYALEAVAALRSRGIEVRYRIIGEGELIEAVAFWRHQLGLDDVVDLVGAVTPSEITAHQHWADVFLHAATSEGFCNAAIEAQGHGVPVVCSDADGLPENIEDGVTGLVVRRRDHAALANAMERIARDPILRRDLAASGPRRVERLFRLDHQLAAWETFYEQALHDHSLGWSRSAAVAPEAGPQLGGHGSNAPS
jgi:colanic acid/amylovoran biosynthesis glycosyltransferase